MKIHRVFADSRKKEFVVQVGKSKFSFPFALLSLKPSAKNPLFSVWIDEEVGGEAISYKLKNGREDTLLLDQILFHNKDPEYQRQIMLYRLTVEAQKLLKLSKMSKRTVARRLSTSPAQLYRLLDQKFYGKTIDQMLKLLFVLGCELEFNILPKVA